MSYTVVYSKQADKAIVKYKKSNKSVYKKLELLIDELHEHPRTGSGHPEQLKGQGGDVYSRHITAHDRIIYKICDDQIIVAVIQVEGHYNDK